MWLSRILYRIIWSKILPNSLQCYWLLTFKSQILVNALLASEAAFWMHSTIALIILCSATNVAFALSKWVRDKVVQLFQDCASVVKRFELPSNQTSLIFVEKHCYH